LGRNRRECGLLAVGGVFGWGTAVGVPDSLLKQERLTNLVADWVA